ncbi:MAG: GH36 C-terminal domain-containing protein, partial [Pirellulaceae bacterium]|nr:GH36 C-terminal domain-containing protein [Pirellulaceae bacterium]
GWKGPLDTYLRSTFTLSTPMIAFGPAPRAEDLNQHSRERFGHYARIYKKFIRPLLPTCRMYHHAPVTSRGGVGASGWFAVEFAAPDRSQGWATIVRIGPSDRDTYRLVPRGLHRDRTYQVTFDSTGEQATIDGLRLAQEGLDIRLEAAMSSELLLFDAQ